MNQQSTIFDNLTIETTDEELWNEFMWYVKTPGKCTLYQAHNIIIKYFQQDNFYKTEQLLWTNPDIRNKLIQNRIKYLNKDISDLTINDILLGFKRSGIYYGYSGFNPLLVKWFYEQYKIKTCYDPCGGWGHRLLGSMDLDLYIYNDISKSTYDRVNDMIEYFSIPNTTTFNNDCRSFIPDCEFECIFTCPPYFNDELYECDKFHNISEYNDFLNSIFDIFNTKESCRVMGIVNKDKYMKNHSGYIDKIPLRPHKNNHLVKSDCSLENMEYLFIYTKENLQNH